LSVRKLPSQRTGKAGTTRDFGVVAKRALPELPSCPALLAGKEPLPSTVEAWDRLWSSDVVQVVDLRSDMESVVRWASLLDERERTFRAFRRQRIVEGSTHQPVLNPLWMVVRSCDAELRALEDRIGLTPKARLMLGITYAEAGKSLDELNRLMEVDDDEEPIVDPRIAIIDAS
jgi:hypothetical protein